MQVIDLRPGRRGTPPRVELWASTGAELVRAVGALVTGQCEGFDVGDDRLAELTARLDDDLRARLEAQPEDTWLFLTSLVGLLEEPGTVEDLLKLLAEEPRVVWRTLAEAPVDEAGDHDTSVLDRYLDGEADADEVRTWFEDIEDQGRVGGLLDHLLEESPEAFVTEVHHVLSAVHAAVGAEMLAEAIGPMQREVVARRQQLEGGRHPGELVVEATNGYELSEDLPVERVLLLPSYWFRPWLIINRIGSTEVLTSPVADEHLALPSAAPPPALVKLTKALGDEGRLRLLRRMGGGPITLSDAMDELDLAKTTAHHHLSILRQAGLVVIRGEGRDSRYALRAHAPSAAAAALEEYLGSAVPLTAETASDAI